MSDNLNQIACEKVDKNIYLAWKFQVTNFLKRKDHEDNIVGYNEKAPIVP